ncbi:hypothetical protein L9F63_005704, partial [Diploptera punctata]
RFCFCRTDKRDKPIRTEFFLINIQDTAGCNTCRKLEQVCKPHVECAHYTFR